MRWSSSASILDLIAAEPDGIAVADLTKICYPDAVGDKDFCVALKRTGAKLADLVRDDCVDPIGFSQGKTLWGITPHGQLILEITKRRCL